MATSNLFIPHISVTELYQVGNSTINSQGTLATKNTHAESFDWLTNGESTRVEAITASTTDITSTFQSVETDGYLPGMMYLKNLGQTADDVIQINSVVSATSPALGPMRPDADVSSPWTNSEYTRIDDVVTQPTGGDLLATNCTSTNEGQEQVWGIAESSGTGTITSITLWINAKDDSFTPSTHTIRIKADGVWGTPQTLAIATSYTWTSHTFTGLSLDASSYTLEVGITADFPDVSPGTFEIDVIYLLSDVVATSTDYPMMLLGPNDIAFFPIEFSGSDYVESNITNLNAQTTINTPINLHIREWSR